ncbi:transcription termination/antitermination protein NusA, partial [bacterium]|nr:transcription termination/antitermination protein NusA [bacterium]
MIKIGAGNLNEVFEEMEREKGISKEVIISSLCDAMVAAYKKHLRVKELENVEAYLDEQSGEIGIFKGKTVVKKVADPDNEISLKEAKEIDEDVELGDEVK